MVLYIFSIVFLVSILFISSLVFIIFFFFSLSNFSLFFFSQFPKGEGQVADLRSLFFLIQAFTVIHLPPCIALNICHKFDVLFSLSQNIFVICFIISYLIHPLFKSLLGAWVAQSIRHPTLAQVMISLFMGSSPVSGCVPTAQSLEPATDSVSPSLLCPSPACALTLSLKNNLKTTTTTTTTTTVCYFPHVCVFPKFCSVVDS